MWLPRLQEVSFSSLAGRGSTGGPSAPYHQAPSLAAPGQAAQFSCASLLLLAPNPVPVLKPILDSLNQPYSWDARVEEVPVLLGLSDKAVGCQAQTFSP